LDMTTANMDSAVGSPVIIKINPDMMPIIQLSLSKGDLDLNELTLYLYDDVLPEIERIPGVASVSVTGAYESEVQVIINETDLATENAKITILNAQIEAMFLAINPEATDIPQIPLLDRDMVSDILLAQNFEYPLGYAEIENDDENPDGTYLVRVGDEFDSASDISDLVVFGFPGMPAFLIDGFEITVSDIASVTYENANEQEYSKVNGDNAISISIQKSSEYATTDVTDAVSEVLASITETDIDTQFTVLLNQGDYIKLATGSVVDNLLWGALLAILVLIIFLRSARATLIVALSIPISLMFAIILIYFSGITLNIVSLGGLALGIGMLVDNSIVVMENIFRYKKQGMSNRDAAIAGTKQVSGAIFASTITTISVFVPVLFIEGFIREIFLEMALTIAYSLTASLVIALTLVPAISSKILKEDSKVKVGEEKGINKVKQFYEKAFKSAFRFKYIILALVVVLMSGSIWLSLTNGFEYFPSSDEGQLTISITNPTDDALNTDDFFIVLDELTDDILEIEDVDVVGMTLGSMASSMFGMTSTNVASASVVLKDNRTLTTREIMASLDDLISTDYSEIDYEISGAQQQAAMLTGSGYQVLIKGNDLDTLKQEAEDLAAAIRLIDGVSEVDDGIGIPADEIKITVRKEDAIEYGYLTAIVGGMIAEMLSGEEVTTTITEDGTIYDVYVYGSAVNSSNITYTVEQIENLVIGQDLYNNDVTVSMVADVDIVEGFKSISHSNGIRSVTVSASYDPEFNSSFVASDIDVLMETYEMEAGYTFEIQGENEEIVEALTTLLIAMGLAIVLIFMIMASQFQSLSYPLIIMFTIPLAFTGGFLALFVTGMTVSVVSMIGFIILVGVVVNNGIVLVDYTNQLREKGMEIKEALLEAGKTRLRPIVMTAITTILALSTMALAFGTGAEMMQPMAVTTIGGLLYATVLTLLVVPIMYYLLTKHTKQVMSSLGIIFFGLATIIGYSFLTEWYIIVIGVVAVALIVVNWVFNKSKKVVEWVVEQKF